MTSLHREQLHVPLLVRWPRTLKPGRIETPVSFIDIYPTLVELLGLSDPGTLRGKSLVPKLREEVPAAPRPIFAELLPDSGVLNACVSVIGGLSGMLGREVAGNCTTFAPIRRSQSTWRRRSPRSCSGFARSWCIGETRFRRSPLTSRRHPWTIRR